MNNLDSCSVCTVSLLGTGKTRGLWQRWWFPGWGGGWGFCRRLHEGPLGRLGQPHTSFPAIPEPKPPSLGAAPHHCSWENMFTSDPKQEDLKGGGAGPERGGGGEGYVQRVGEELGSIEQVMSACDCLSIQEVFQVPLPLFRCFPINGAQEKRCIFIV